MNVLLLKRSIQRIAAATTFVVAMVGASLPAGAQTGNLPILFQSTRDGDNFYHVYGMNADGSNPTSIGDPSSVGFWGRYSPNRQQIVFGRRVADPNSPVGFRYQIFVMDADGTNQVNISNDLMHHHNTPAWSPDGRIAFVSDPLDNSAPRDLWIMNADGSNRQLVYHSTGVFGAWYPSVSPDGTKIAFSDDSRGGLNHDDIYVINPDGSNLRQLTNSPALDYGPNWSPDGTKIAFTRERVPSFTPGSIAGNGDIYVMNADGSNQIPLTNHGNDDFYPTWSPDGSKIVFNRGRGNANSEMIDVYVMNADGSNAVQLTHTPPFNNWVTDWCCR